MDLQRVCSYCNCWGGGLVKEQRKRRDRLNSSEHYTAASCCTVYTKLTFVLITFFAQLRPCIELNTSRLFASSTYSNTTSFGPTGCYHQVYKLQRKLLPPCHAATHCILKVKKLRGLKPHYQSILIRMILFHILTTCLRSILILSFHYD
jgi:hypothetical protein